MACSAFVALDWCVCQRKRLTGDRASLVQIDSCVPAFFVSSAMRHTVDLRKATPDSFMQNKAKCSIGLGATTGDNWVGDSRATASFASSVLIFIAGFEKKCAPT